MPLSWVALWNGYPLIFSDSQRYLNGGILRYVPSEAPIFYGAFMIPLHLNGVSLWPVVAAQCLLISYAVSAALRALNLFEPLTFMALMGFLAALTSAPWFAGFIMPDFLAPIVVLVMFALFSGWSGFRPLERGFLVALALFGLASHISHIVLGLGLAALFMALRWMGRSVPRRALVTLAVLPIVAAVAVVAMNIASKGKVALTRDGPVLLLARAFADGPAEDYMRTHCAASRWRLCAALPRLPHDSEQFLWDPDHSAWTLGIPGDELRTEAGQIVAGTISTYPGRMAALALGNVLRQLVTFQAGVDFKRWTDSDTVLTVTGVVRRFFPQEFDQLQHSRQQTGRLQTARPNLVYAGVAVIALAGLILLLIRLQDPDLNEFAVVIAVALLINAAATAPFSVVADRYQARIVWLLPLAFAVSLLAFQRRRAIRPVLVADRFGE
jgi:hypothetical protein